MQSLLLEADPTICWALPTVLGNLLGFTHSFRQLSPKTAPLLIKVEEKPHQILSIFETWRYGQSQPEIRVVRIWELL